MSPAPTESREPAPRGRRAAAWARCLVALALAGASAPARAHDVTADVSLSLSRVDERQLSAGRLGVALGGAYDFTEAFSAWLTVQYMRELPSTTEGERVSGADIFLLSPGLSWMHGDHWFVLGSGVFAPPTKQLKATRIDVLDGPLAGTTQVVTISSENASAGATLKGGYATGGLSDFESTFDVAVSATSFDVTQSLVLPNTLRAAQLRAACGQRPEMPVCALVDGAKTPLWQTKLAATYTAMLSLQLEVGLEAALFLYDRDPTDVGYFSLALLGREVGSGIPVAPQRLQLRTFLARRWERLSLKGSWTIGPYVDWSASSHLATLQVSWKLGESVRLQALVLTQLEASARGLSYTGTSISLGTTVLL